MSSSPAEIGEKVLANFSRQWERNREKGRPLLEAVAAILAVDPDAKAWQVRSRLNMKAKPTRRHISRVMRAIKTGTSRGEVRERARRVSDHELTAALSLAVDSRPIRGICNRSHLGPEQFLMKKLREFDPLADYKIPPPLKLEPDENEI